MVTADEFERFDNSPEKCRECPHCKGPVILGQPDPCLGYMPGVIAACCGHGRTKTAYVFFENGTIIRGFNVIEWELPAERQKWLYPHLRNRGPEAPIRGTPGPSIHDRKD